MPLLVMAKAGLLLLTLLLLSSPGGAGAYGSAVLLPLQWVAAKTSRASGRPLWILLAGATALETAWALTYAVAERQPYVWLVPTLTFLATTLLFAATTKVEPIRAAAACRAKDDL